VPRFAPWIAHVIFIVSVLALGYSAKNYLWLTRGETQVVNALAPVGASKVAEAISLQLPGTKSGKGASSLARNQARELHALHNTWLDLTRSHVIYARNQLIFWALLSALSLSLVFVLHSRKRMGAA
jgi:hypothetical protein